MTTQPVPDPAAGPPAYTVTAPPDSRLEQLQAMYPTLKAQADAAASALKDCTDALKLELTTVAPGQQRVDLVGGRHGPGLQLDYRESWRYDSKRMRADAEVPTEEGRFLAALYVKYAKKSGAWYLNPAKGGQS